MRFAGVPMFALAVAGQARAADPIKLGLILDMSGFYTDNTGAGSVMAACMAVEDCGGQMLTRPVEIVVADHQNRPDIAAGVACRWLDVEQVAAIVDVSASSAALAVMGSSLCHRPVAPT